MSTLMPSLSLFILSSLVAGTMANKQVLGEEILCKIVKWAVFGTQLVSCSDTGDTGNLMHILCVSSVAKSYS